MKIKPSPICDLCKTEEDSYEHMLINCVKSQKLWREVEQWFLEIGVNDYVINENVIILAELQKSYWLKVIILITKKLSLTQR